MSNDHGEMTTPSNADAPDYTSDQDQSVAATDAQDAVEGEGPTADGRKEADELAAGPAEEADPGNDNPATTAAVE